MRRSKSTLLRASPLLVTAGLAVACVHAPGDGKTANPVHTAEPKASGPNQGTANRAAAGAPGDSQRLTPMTSPPRANKARASGAFTAWLLEGPRELERSLPHFATAQCGTDRLTQRGGEEVSRISMARSHKREAARFEAVHGVSFVTARKMYSAFYRSMLKNDFGFVHASTMFRGSWHKGSQPILRGHVLLPSGDKQHQIYWRDGTFQKEFVHPTQSVGGARPANNYADLLMPPPFVSHMPDEVEGLLVADGGGYHLWLDGRKHVTVFDIEGLRGTSRHMFIQTTRKCTFRDTSGRTFGGRFPHSFKK